MFVSYLKNLLLLFLKFVLIIIIIIVIIIIKKIIIMDILNVVLYLQFFPIDIQNKYHYCISYEL
jgi:hypothetical protein